ncbi:hypothetical protein [Actinoplanes italicus]|uniref:Uncharacterized protein n=1 Tax=Actinoplanes italicus TaxID=113567 RepID=A0A2T0KHW0_9ACTN|nr:hypothetical protein [Actinoplanes italicus]PRX23015.1 hypothetical protein CLV67_104543 [Actinoplanes italicus]
MSVRAVVFREQARPAREEPSMSEVDRSAEAMRRLRRPFDNDFGGVPANRP